MTGEAEDWLARDAAAVWHGFTQMSTYGDNAPIIVAEAEGRRVGTLSKTLGSLGGFVAGPAALVDLLVNRARSYIFTTASTPADTAAALAAVRVLRSPEGTGPVARLRSHVDRVRPGHPSPIVPVVLGDEARAVAASALSWNGVCWSRRSGRRRSRPAAPASASPFPRPTPRRTSTR